MQYSRIEWCDTTVNPIVGCSHNCSYCYARRMAKRFKHDCELCYKFKPHPHLERLKQLNPRQKHKRIFINSMWDWNDRLVKEEWRIPIIQKMQECSQHTFLVLSKAPTFYDSHQPIPFPKNVWIGATCDGRGTQWQVEVLASTLIKNKKFISFEPLLHPISEDVRFKLKDIDWVIIGAETGNRREKVTCKREWVERILDACKFFGIPVFLKDNLYTEGVYKKEEFMQLRKFLKTYGLEPIP